MSRASYTPITAKSALNRVRGMPFDWSLNPYRGCVHACQYCYARETHLYLGLNAGRDFESTIFYKQNIAAVLQRELTARSWNGDSVAIGTATDAYQPLEGRLRITRDCLELFARYRNPLSIVTKSTLIVRDTDCLEDISRFASARVYFSITTVDAQLWRELEPGTPPPAQRLRALERLSVAGVRTGVLMAPVIPGLTDSEAAIDAVAKAAAEHGATSFAALPLRLATPVRRHFTDYLAANHPDLLPRYVREDRGQHLSPAEKHRLEQIESIVADRYQLQRRSRVRTESSPQPSSNPRQLALL